MEERILRLHEVVMMTGLSKSTIYAEIAKGGFPKQVKLTGNRSVGWLRSSVSEWIMAKK